MKIIRIRIIKRTDGNNNHQFFARRQRHFLWIPFLPFWVSLKEYVAMETTETVYKDTLSEMMDYVENKYIPFLKEERVEYEIITEKTYTI